MQCAALTESEYLDLSGLPFTQDTDPMSSAELRTRLHGTVTDLVTPFRDNEVDLGALADLIEWQISEGVDALLVCGITGEVPTLIWEERIAIIRRAVDVVAGRIPVIAGTGTNNTASTIAHTSAAAEFGADAAMLVVPYYSRPSQRGMVLHFSSVASRVGIPLIIENSPSLTGADMTIETFREITAFANVIGFADGSADLTRLARLTDEFEDRLALLSTHDLTSLAFCSCGGSGAISAVSNLLPRQRAQMHRLAIVGDIKQARKIEARTSPLLAALAIEPTASAVKNALHQMKDLSDEVRLPLVTVSPDTDAVIARALNLAGAQSHSRSAGTAA